MALPGDVVFGIGRASARWAADTARPGWRAGSAGGTAMAPLPAPARTAPATPPTATPGAQHKETPSGPINGSNAVFSTAHAYVPGSTVLFLNGLAQSDPDDYSEVLTSGLRFVLPPEPGDRLLVLYTEA